MPKPPDNKRVSFPMRGASDRYAYIDIPGDLAPIGTILNVRPDVRSPGSELGRGGQRPGLREAQDPDGNPWGPVGDGPIQLIYALPRAAAVDGFQLGAGVSTHGFWENHLSQKLAGNLFVLRRTGTATRPSLARHLSVGTFDPGEFEVETLRDLTAACWTDQQSLAGGVNENPVTTGDRDAIIFKATYTVGGANNGFGSPGWTEFSNPFDPALETSTIGPFPIEALDHFYGNTGVLGNVLFVSHTVRAILGEPLNKGFVAAYPIDQVGLTQLVRPFFPVYNEAVAGTPSSAVLTSVSPNPGAIEVTDVRCEQVGGVNSVYVAYDANPNSEACIARYNVNQWATHGLSQGIPGSGGFQVNGITFAVAAQVFGPTIDPLQAHYLSINYPRGARPMGVSVAPDGSVYWVQSSTGWGPNYAGGANPSHHPNYQGARPITVCKVNAAGTYFEWESVTSVDPGESYTTRIGDPELRWVEADADGCFCGGREVLGSNCFAVNSDDGGIRWRWRSGTVGGGSKLFAAALDPGDGHLWVTGDRVDSWLGHSAPGTGVYAQLWKLHKESGEVLSSYDVGASVAGLSLDINPATLMLLLGTSASDS